MKKSLTALLCLGLLAPAGPAAAQGSFKPKVAKFKVTVKGVQSTNWKSQREGTGGCNPTLKENGTEVSRFYSTRAVRVKALYYRSLRSLILTTGSGPGKAPQLPVRAKVTRRSSTSIGPLPWFCQGIGSANQVDPDCGTKYVTTTLSLRPPGRRDRGRFMLTGSLPHQGGFTTCRGSHPEFPVLLGFKSNGRSIGARFPRGEIYDRSLGKVITIARGYRKDGSGETTSGTSIRWEATFSRIR